MPLAPNVIKMPPIIRVGTQEPAEEKKKLRVAAYARVSTENEEQEGSYEIQVEYYTKMIKANPEWEFVKVYADDGISGTDATRRDGFQQMIEDCRLGKIDFIITKSISRFARNTVDCLNYTRELKDLNIAVRFEKESINTMDVSGELLLTIMSAMAQQESESISANVRLGIKFRNEKGVVRINHNRFLGYTKDENGHLVIDPEQAAVVRRIFSEYLSGKSCIQICHGLEADGIKNGAGNIRWHDSNIRNILTNEKYVGDAILQKTVTTNVLKHKREKNDGSLAAQYYVSDNHEPIISRQMFLEAEAELQRRSSKPDENGKRKYYNARNALGGVLTCASCGHPFRRHVWYIHGRKEVVWRCRNRVENGTDACMARTLKERDLQDAIVSALGEIHNQREKNLPLIREQIELEIAGSNAATITKLEKEQKALQKKLVALDDPGEQEVIGEKIRSIKLRLGELRNMDEANFEKVKELKALEEMLENHDGKIQKYDDILVRRFISSIVVYDYSITIRLKNGKEISMQV